MTSLRQKSKPIDATPPEALALISKRGKHRSRRNAVRHGLYAETVIEIIEDIDHYRGFEATVTADIDDLRVENWLAVICLSATWRAHAPSAGRRLIQPRKPAINDLCGQAQLHRTAGRG